MTTKLFLALSLLVSCYSCSYKANDKYASDLNKVGLKDYAQYKYIFFFTDGCSGCRSKFLYTILEDKWYQKCAVVISKSNLAFLDGFRNENIFIDSTNYLATHNVDFMTDGFLQTENGKPVIKHINVENSDSLLNYFSSVMK